MSSHELLDDDKLSKVPAVHPETIAEHQKAAKKRTKSAQVLPSNVCDSIMQ